MDYGLMGWDSYPIIVTSRIQNGTDFFGTFTEELMDGRYFGHYYRPLLNLSFAADYLFWGADSFGYQLTNAVLFGLAGFVLFALARRMNGARALVGPTVGLAFFLLQESHFEVIPVASRRPELLCAVFAGLALFVQLSPKSLGKKWPWAPAFWMACAAASKETGYVLPVLGVLAVFSWSPAPRVAERALQALRAGIMHAAFVGIVLIARLSVLGGLGGPGAKPPAGGRSALALSETLFGRLFVPQSMTADRDLFSWLVIGLAVCFLAAAWLCRTKSEGNERSGSETSPTRAAILGACWVLVVGLLYGLSRSIEQWYLFLPVAGLSLVLGAGSELLWSAWRRCVAGRGVAVVGGLLLLSFCYVQTRYSPLLRSYPEWEKASQVSEAFLTRLEMTIDSAPDGAVVTAPPLPRWFPPAKEGPTIRGAAIMDVYSVQAWAELILPERKVRVVRGRAPSRPASDEVIVQVVR